MGLKKFIYCLFNFLQKYQEDFEEGKRDIITREIGKFREIMKVREKMWEINLDYS